MPIVLIVDDSSADQALIQEYIQQEEIDWIVEFTDCAEQAIVRLEQLAIDVVVTDMRMPGMDGFELLDHIRTVHPHIPVVLITEHDSESVASEALDRGAASYVSKQELSTRLIEVVKQMVQVAGLSRGFDVLFQCVEDMNFRLFIENDPRLIAPLINALDLMALRMELCDACERQRIGVALDEAILNAMYHGNLELPAEQLVEARSSLRNGSVPAAVAERAQAEPFRNRRVEILASFNQERLKVKIIDEGPGYDASIRERAANTRGEQGHQGLVVIHHLMDDVSFNDEGNEITMTKLRQPSKTPTPISVD